VTWLLEQLHGPRIMNWTKHAFLTECERVDNEIALDGAYQDKVAECGHW
jgi:hypothetical protein